MPRWENGGGFMRFSIRDVIWVTALVALALAWWVDRWWLANQHANAMRMLAEETKRLVEGQHPGTRVEIKVDGGGISKTISK
jgi:hypothetical protein